jgi:hypothetical protein
MAAGHPDNSSNLKQFQSSNWSLGIENGNWTNRPRFLASVQARFPHVPNDAAGNIHDQLRRKLISHHIIQKKPAFRHEQSVTARTFIIANSAGDEFAEDIAAATRSIETTSQPRREPDDAPR